MSPDRIGEYRIEQQLEASTSCIIYETVHRVLPRRAIVKVMYEPVPPPGVRVLREALMLEALHHPGIIRVYDAGLLSDRRAWFAHELVEGTSVASYLSPSAIDRLGTVALMRDLAEILDHSHSRGVIHAGLRPDRIVLAGPLRGYPVCIADWSDMRPHDAPAIPYVPSTSSWHYTSPELACGDAVDDRTDVFSLGVIGYQMLTGVLPSRVRLATAHDRAGPHEPTENRCPDAPRELTALIDRMLSYDPADRPSSADVQFALARLAHSLEESQPIAPETVSNMRIRQPRWTPPLRFDYEPEDGEARSLEARPPKPSDDPA